MKSKYIIFVFVLLAHFSDGQTFNDYLQKIENNNKQLEAARKLVETRKVRAHIGIYPKPFSVNYGYFPNNNTVDDQKQTLNATQSFYMPGVYGKMKGLAKEKVSMAELVYEAERIEILYRAYKLMIRLVYFQKVHQKIEERLKNAENQLAGMKKKSNAGDANVMEINKAKFHLLHIKRLLSQNRIEKERLKDRLKLFNGEKSLNFQLTSYPVFPDLPVDSILAQKKEMLPSVNIADQQLNIAEKNITLEKSFNSPEFNIGYGSETVGSSSFKGVVMGASIPLWTNKNKVKAARAEAGYRETEFQNKMLEVISETENQYKTYISLKQNLEEYSSTIENLGSIELLKKSLELDQISVLDYYREVEYYYNIYDEYLELEKDYYLALNELYRYRL